MAKVKSTYPFQTAESEKKNVGVNGSWESQINRWRQILGQGIKELATNQTRTR